MRTLLDQFWQQTAALAPRIGLGLLVFAAFWLASTAIRKFILRGALSAHFHHTHIVRLVARAASMTILIVGLVTVLGTVGINVSALVAGLGLTGFVLGFAMKEVISNFVAGRLLLVYRPFELGDYIAVAGVEGQVVDIDLRYTRLQKDHVTHRLPNSGLFTNNISLHRRRPEALAS